MIRVGRKDGRDALAIERSHRERVRALSEPDGRTFSKWLVLHLALWAGGIAALFIVEGNLALQLLISALLGSELHAMTVLQHDCGHRSAYRSKAANLWVGRYLAFFIYLPFTTFADLHRWHHASLGNAEKDPDNWFYAGGKWQLFLRECLFMPRFVWLSLTTDLLTAQSRRRVARELAFNTVGMAGVAALFVSIGATDVLLYGILAPMLFLALVYNPISRGYEHFPMASLARTDARRKDLRFNTVTVTSKVIGLLWANINYHVEHHLYPRVPFYRLPELHRLMQHKAYIRSRYPLIRNRAYVEARYPLTTDAA